MFSKKNKAIVDLDVEYRDLQNNVYAKATKTIYIADRNYYEEKLKK